MLKVEYMVQMDGNAWQILAVQMIYPEAKVSKELDRSMFEQQKDFHYDFGISWDNIARIWDMLHFPISRINVRGAGAFVVGLTFC